MPIRLNYQSAALRVCVDQIEDGAFCGHIVGQRLSAPITFSDLNEFFAKINALLDVQRFPQAFQSMRAFANEHLTEVPAALSEEEMSFFEEVEGAKGECATFLLQVTTRQNSSWQGYIDWLDGSSKQLFNSSLEFVKIVVQRIS